MRRLAVLAPLLAAACSTVPADGAPPPAGTCNVEGLNVYVGRDATPETGAEVTAKSGARVIRWVPKDSMVTMEFSAERVTVYLDANNKIERINCG